MPLLGFLLYSLLLLAPNALLFFAAGGALTPDVAAAVQATVATLAVYMLLCSLAGRLWLLAWLLLPFVLIMPAELYYLSQYHIPSSPHIIAVIAETNHAEAGDFLKGTSGTILLTLLLNTVIAIGLCIFMTRQRLRWQGKSRWATLLLTLTIVVQLLFNSSPISSEGNAEASNASSNSNLFAAGHIDLTPLQNGFPFGIPLRVGQFMQANRDLEESAARLRNFRFHARQEVTISGKQVYVLVIGETGRRDRWQLNGYTRATNPLLSQEHNLVNFSNMLTVSSATRLAVPFMLTRKPAQDAMRFNFGEKSFISAFKEAGFATYWLSMQSPMGKYDTSISVYAKEADHIAFYNPTDFQQQGQFDTRLLPPLQDILSKPESKQLIILHTLGSHYDYAARYPDAYDVFKPSTKPAGSVGMREYAKRVEISNSYDNSVLFTDYFLSEVIREIKASNSTAFMLYAADHGEDLMSKQCVQSGHGLTDKNNLEIPAVAWYSERYAAQFPEKIAALHGHANAPLNTQYFFASMTDAAAIRVDHDNIGMSFLSPRMQAHPRLVMTGDTQDYDHTPQFGGCETLRGH